MNRIKDGRTTRWEAHNAQRRHDLVASTLRAIRRHGAGVGMDDIAATAGTSKPVIYRHFRDKAGLYQAVVEWVHSYIWTSLHLDDAELLEPQQLVRQLADTYLRLVEDDQEIYQFVTNRPAGETPVDDPVLSITTRIGNEVSRVFGNWLRAHELDDGPANIWGHGVVGFIWATADRWILTNLRRPRPDVVNYIDQLFTPAFNSQRSPE